MKFYQKNNCSFAIENVEISFKELFKLSIEKKQKKNMIKLSKSNCLKIYVVIIILLLLLLVLLLLLLRFKMLRK
jgi:flagellar biosynthesis/type III secretory pathway M-ring protein FliF/YscJ